MHYTYKTGGTCSTMIDFDIIDGKLHNIVFTNGCNGNLKAIGSLLEGADPKFAIERLSGICCGFKNTSCGDQLARAIRQAVGDCKICAPPAGSFGAAGERAAPYRG